MQYNFYYFLIVSVIDFKYVAKLRNNDFEAGIYIDWFVYCSVTGTSHRIVLKLPIFFLKFATGASMNAQDFFNRWKQLNRYVFVNVLWPANCVWWILIKFPHHLTSSDLIFHSLILLTFLSKLGQSKKPKRYSTPRFQSKRMPLPQRYNDFHWCIHYATFWYLNINI